MPEGGSVKFRRLQQANQLSRKVKPLLMRRTEQHNKELAIRLALPRPLQPEILYHYQQPARPPLSVAYCLAIRYTKHAPANRQTTVPVS
jgi:hypothetical protein